MSAKMKKLLAERNLDIDKAVAYLRIQDWELEGLNDYEIMTKVIDVAKKVIGDRESELIKIILEQSLKDCPGEEMTETKFHERQNWH